MPEQERAALRDRGGDLDENFKRSTLNGWRFEGLPWEQM